VEQPFRGKLRQGRPEDDLRAAQWDLDLGRSYRQMLTLMAWLHLAENLRRFREEAVDRLINGEDGAAEWREVVKTIDAILRVPDAMIKTADQAKAWLSGVENNE
jgi:hypothetical protein